MKTFREYINIMNEGLGDYDDKLAIKKAIDALYMAPHHANFSEDEYKKVVELLDILRAKMRGEELAETELDPVRRVEELFRNK